ncbi:hypothetical protein [Patiriisocius hiemis]|uniref:Secreted protein n=1 Tax=Patiriisocius hiemis TaxID=3075604 RepID=A0ABU2Y9J1_9FLAO|nr:hypothetical protein [Constantimarinum sp. W242]MDT0554854.1 hypothetical protein [Constantimarinum sp. W242]
MKHLFFTLLLLTTFFVQAQIETAKPKVKIEAEKNDPTPEGLKLPNTKVRGLTNPNKPITSNIDPNISKNDKKLDITKGDGLLDYKTNNAPKYFTKDKEASEKYGRDQNLGEVITKASTVNVLYRDHEFVDGDRIRVLVNDNVVQSYVTLQGSFQGFDLPLEKGINKVEFIALNQGASGPNTAELHIYDDKDMLISAKEWNLLTGYRASFLIIND